jgi:rod shape determining protein RodA
MRVAWRAPAWDYALLGSAAALSIFGAIAMASAASTIHPHLVSRHVLWVAIGMTAGLVIGYGDYRRWTDLAWAAYGLSLLLLLLVELMGAMRLGATRWLSIFGFSLQPAELMKLSTIWLLARYLGNQPHPLPVSVCWKSLALAAPPALLILVQPDLGSASIFGAIWLGMVWCAGAPKRFVAGLLLAGVAFLPVGWHALKDYQRDRLLVFINPHADPLGAGYTIIQSVIAIGSGGLWGRGWFAGTQNQLSFLPERHSDFLFSVVGEEWGLIGSAAVIALFGLMLSRTADVASDTNDGQGRLLIAGIFSWLAYQACVNMGMVMGLLPVVGVPLPLLSYGGSSMVMVWTAVGIIQSIRRSERG